MNITVFGASGGIGAVEADLEHVLHLISSFGLG